MPAPIETYTDPKAADSQQMTTSLKRIQVFNPPEDRKDESGITTTVQLEFEVPDSNPIAARRIAAHARSAGEVLADRYPHAVVSPPQESRDNEGRKLILKVMGESSEHNPLVDRVVATLKTVREFDGHALISEALAAAVTDRKKDASTSPPQPSRGTSPGPSRLGNGSGIGRMGF